MKKVSTSVMAVAALVGFSIPASAQLVFSVDGSIGSHEQADTGDAPNYIMAGDIFTAPNNALATTLSFVGDYGEGTPPADSFTIRLYSTSGASTVPTTLLATSTFDFTRTPDSYGHSFYDFSGTLNTPFTLNVGTTYYLGISDTTTPYDYFGLAVNTDSQWSLSGGATDVSYIYGPDPGWRREQDVPALMDLSGEDILAPEPSTWAMLVGGLALLGFCVRRKLA